MAFEVVTGRFLAPDGSPLSGSVVFTPAFSSATDGQAVTAPAPVPAQLDAEGRLEVSLLVPGEGTSPSAWTWRACLRLRHAGGVVGLPAFNFELVEGQPVNLAEVAPVPDPVTGDYITRGEPGATPEITIGQVQTVPAGQEAVTITGPAESPTLDFALPAGRLGWTGDRGPQGLPGAPGPAGPAGADGVGIESLGVAGAALKITTTDGRTHLLPFPAGLVSPSASGSVTTGLEGVGLASGQLLFEDSGDGTGRVWASAAQVVGKPGPPGPPGEPATVQDTGWRDIRSLVGLPAGADPAKNRFEVLRIRRVGHMVMVLMRSVNTVDKYPLAQALPGFSSAFDSGFIRPTPGTNTQEIYISSGQLIFLGGAKNGGSINHARFTYLTADPWPAALPGTAVS